jgi:mono/diheme cytochrome c family protein
MPLNKRGYLWLNVRIGEIFWVIKNGIGMTGMPSFARIKVQDPEIWAITAFVKKIPSVSPADYKTWTNASASAR